MLRVNILIHVAYRSSNIEFSTYMKKASGQNILKNFIYIIDR